MAALFYLKNQKHTNDALTSSLQLSETVQMISLDDDDDDNDISVIEIIFKTTITNSFQVLLKYF